MIQALDGGVAILIDSTFVSRYDTFKLNVGDRGGCISAQALSNITLYKIIATENSGGASYGSVLYQEDGVLNIYHSILNENNPKNTG